jgi:ABC-type uncharacterized transport system permease subunit
MRPGVGPGRGARGSSWASSPAASSPPSPWRSRWAALALLGLDPRGPLLGTYVQRNSLVVGFVMGFAIIPIIYTIAEDALAAVPDHLRSASLASGATPWQTAWRIVIPTAMSGLFSAVMIGLGRAVGETMIVLMAAGNTPILDWNIFNGFRTLSANIAVELPEAVRNTLPHALPRGARALLDDVLVLAEIVRIRFRKGRWAVYAPSPPPASDTATARPRLALRAGRARSGSWAAGW